MWRYYVKLSHNSKASDSHTRCTRRLRLHWKVWSVRAQLPKRFGLSRRHKETVRSVTHETQIPGVICDTQDTHTKKGNVKNVKRLNLYKGHSTSKKEYQWWHINRYKKLHHPNYQADSRMWQGSKRKSVKDGIIVKWMKRLHQVEQCLWYESFLKVYHLRISKYKPEDRVFYK